MVGVDPLLREQVEVLPLQRDSQPREVVYRFKPLLALGLLELVVV